MISPDGSTKIYTDPQLGFSFVYPATWTEDTCQGGSSGVLIGNLFRAVIAVDVSRRVPTR